MDQKSGFPQKGQHRLRHHRQDFAGATYGITVRKDDAAADIANAICFEIIFLHLNRLETSQVLRWMAFVVMPNHMHLVLTIKDGTLAAAMKKLKGATSRDINLARGAAGNLWTKGYYDHLFRQGDSIAHAVDYIRNNPLRKGLVYKADDWPFTRIRWEMVN